MRKKAMKTFTRNKKTGVSIWIYNFN